jgi:hypothetical protein
MPAASICHRHFEIDCSRLNILFALLAVSDFGGKVAAELKKFLEARTI